MWISMYKNIFRTVPVNINVPGYIQDCTCGYLCSRMYLELYLWISIYQDKSRIAPWDINVLGCIQDSTCGYLFTILYLGLYLWIYIYQIYLGLYLWISIYQDIFRIVPVDIYLPGYIQDCTCGYIFIRIYLGLYLLISMYQDALQLLKPSCTGSCSYRRKLKECTKSRPGIEHRKLNKNPNLQWRHLLNIPNIQSVQTNSSMLN